MVNFRELKCFELGVANDWRGIRPPLVVTVFFHKCTEYRCKTPVLVYLTSVVESSKFGHMSIFLLCLTCLSSLRLGLVSWPSPISEKKQKHREVKSCVAYASSCILFDAIKSFVVIYW